MIFYHGSSILFPKFDLSHALEGDGKVKFGYSVYLTGSLPTDYLFSKVVGELTTFGSSQLRITAKLINI